MMQFFQRLLGKTSAPAPIRGPLGLHLNAGFTLDTLAFRLLESSLLVELPGEKYTVAAASRIDLGGGSQIFRYYTSGDEFLQINTTGGIDDATKAWIVKSMKQVALFQINDQANRPNGMIQPRTKR